jgi:parvulin-like peptidyl-prolyl isomerase
MNKVLVVIVVLLTAAGGYWAGRTSRQSGVLDGSGGDGAVVTRFAGRTLRASEVQARAGALPEMMRARVASADARKAFVEELVRGELLAHLAEEKGYERDPEFLKRYVEELGSFYLQKEFEEPERKKTLSDDELHKYFDEHRSQLSRPERVRIALVVFMATNASEKESKRAQARAALREAQANAKDYYAFGSVARARSEDPRTRAAGGEVGYASREDLEHVYGPDLAEAAFDMKNTNEVRSAVVESADAFYVVKLLGREAAYEPRFETMRDALRARLSTERRNEDRKRFMEEIWKKAEVKIDEQALKNLQLTAAGRP